MSHPNHISVAVVGATGFIGKLFLSQLETIATRYKSDPFAHSNLSLVYIGRSTRCVFSPSLVPISFNTWESDLETSSTPPLEPTQLADLLSKSPRSSILVDCTTSQDFADTYPRFLSRGVSVVTPNKKAFSSGMTLWNAIFNAAANARGDLRSNGFVFHEGTVGAGMPVISTMKELLETGDVILKVQGVFSGSMSYLFNNYMPLTGVGAASFSAVLKQAKEQGSTEPDPREDLKGLDVARKLTIIARLAGMQVASPTSFSCQSLIPPPLESCTSSDEFLARLGEYDDHMDALRQQAASEEKVLRYIGIVDLVLGTVEVALRKLDKSDPVAGLKGTEQIISFQTRRYDSSPLVIQGSGAGEPSAMGVAGDVIKVCNVLRR